MTSQAEAAQAASGSSFYAGMRILPPAEREAMYAIYAYCRAVDDIADDQGGTRAAREDALAQWRRAIDALAPFPAGRARSALTEAVEFTVARAY